MCLKLCGISGDCRSRPVNVGDEPVNELMDFITYLVTKIIFIKSNIGDPTLEI